MSDLREAAGRVVDVAAGWDVNDETWLASLYDATEALAAALSNPTSSVSTEGVLPGPESEFRQWVEVAEMAIDRNGSIDWDDSRRLAEDVAAKLWNYLLDGLIPNPAINPDSPVPQISAKESQTLAEPRCSDCSCCSAAKVLGVCGNCDQGNLTCDDCPDINPDSVDPKP